MLAIPTLRSRVAPVLNWCSTVLIVPRDAARAQEGLELRFEDIQPYRLLRELRERAVRTLICGALTKDLLAQGERLGITIIHGVAGEVSEVFQAYREHRLDGDEFRLPGCPCAGRHRESRGQAEHVLAEGGDAPPRNSSAKSASPTRVCPRCGMEVPDQRGRQGAVTTCPGCACPVSAARKDPIRPR